MGAIRGYMKATMIATLKTNDSTDLRARGMVIFYGRAATAGWECAGGVGFRTITKRRTGAVFVARVGPSRVALGARAQPRPELQTSVAVAGQERFFGHKS